MNEIAVARHAILDLGSEDYYHLGDAAAYLSTVPEDRRRDVAKDALLALIQEGYVQLYFGRMATNDVAPVRLQDVVRVLDDAGAWELHGNEVYCFANTPQGDELYMSGRTIPSDSPAA